MATAIDKGMIAKGKMAPGVMEEIDRVNVLTKRVQKRRDEYLAAAQHICAERSRLVTESWKETEGQPMVLRRAKLLFKMLQGLSITIKDGELIGRVLETMPDFVTVIIWCISFAAMRPAM